MQENKVEKMAKNLCKFIEWYNESKTPEWYHFYTGYLQAMRDIGITVEIYDNELVYCNNVIYKVGGNEGA